ncbi:MAG: hypothetical protein QN163_04785 [Armatimonadota bacterium]|nr:hypothetical protein [Armatimonadota bacterium]MDR5696117.1 hypothetical protein [Armatimonadota bacterium]
MRRILLLCTLALVAVPVGAQSPPPPEMVEVYRVRLDHQAGGAIEASVDRGATWRAIGHVARPAEDVAVGFNAARWGTPGTVVASGANAVHIKVGDSPEGRGLIVSLMPRGAPGGRHVVGTDIPGGTAIFGGRFAPFVGNPVVVERPDGVVPLAEQAPRIGDRMVITVQRPARYPLEIEFENRFGGLVRARYADRSERVVAVVLRPVAGVGRFGGTEYVGVGRVRANHPGVIDISTSPIGQVGGFQIIPRDHAHSAELIGAILGTQWMVVGPVNPLDPSPQGTQPLFSSFIMPRYESADLTDEEWMRRMAERFLVMVRLREGPWQLMPPLVGKDNGALLEMTHFKILLGLWAGAGAGPPTPAATPSPWIVDFHGR